MTTATGATGTTTATTRNSSNTVQVNVNTGGFTNVQHYDLTAASQLPADSTPVPKDNLGNSVPGIGVTATSVTAAQNFVSAPGIENSNQTLQLYRPTDSSQALNFSSFGLWSIPPAGQGAGFTGLGTTFGAVATGKDTPASAVPKSGVATYAGSTVGVLVPSATTAASNPGASLSPTIMHGDALLTANWATSIVAGQFNIPNVMQVQSTATIAAGSNTYTGAAHTTQVAPTLPPLGGDIRGAFYGPTANETAGTWTLRGIGVSALGSFGAKRQ